MALLPVERSLLLLAALGAGHEDGVAAHTWAGTAVATWACVHGEGEEAQTAGGMGRGGMGRYGERVGVGWNGAGCVNPVGRGLGFGQSG